MTAYFNSILVRLKSISSFLCIMFHTIRDDMIAYKDYTLYISISQIFPHLELLSAEAYDERLDNPIPPTPVALLN